MVLFLRGVEPVQREDVVEGEERRAVIVGLPASGRPDRARHRTVRRRAVGVAGDGSDAGALETFRSWLRGGIWDVVDATEAAPNVWPST